MATVKLSKFLDAMGFENLTPNVDMSGIRITTPDVNRPALQLTGYFQHFDKERVQMVGYVEYTYLSSIPMERKLEIYKQYLQYEIPCTIFCSHAKPDKEFINLANVYGRPVFYGCSIRLQNCEDIQRRRIGYGNSEIIKVLRCNGF